MMLTPEQLAALRDNVEIGLNPVVEVDVRLSKLLSHIDAQQARIAELEDRRAKVDRAREKLDEATRKDAARYIAVRSELIGVRNDKKVGAVEKSIIAAVRRVHMERGEDPSPAEFDAAIDAAMQSTWPEDTSDYGSRIDVIGQNGNDALAYQEIKP